MNKTEIKIIVHFLRMEVGRKEYNLQLKGTGPGTCLLLFGRGRKKSMNNFCVLKLWFFLEKYNFNIVSFLIPSYLYFPLLPQCQLISQHVHTAHGSSKSFLSPGPSTTSWLLSGTKWALFDLLCSLYLTVEAAFCLKSLRNVWISYFSTLALEGMCFQRSL